MGAPLPLSSTSTHVISRHTTLPGATALALMLAALSMVGPFAVDTYLPAFANMEVSLHATAIEVQQTLTVYLLSFGVMTLLHGALSDAFGRRNIILAALAIFALASLGCAISPSVGWLCTFRILQGISAGAGIVIGRAIIRDIHSGTEAARLLSLVTMIFSIAPALAPVIGGGIVKFLNWRAVFFFLFIYTVLLLAYCYRMLPETLPEAKRQPFNPGSLKKSYSRIFRSPLFHLKTATVALNFAGLFLYVAAAPAFLSTHLGLRTDQFGWQFIPSVAGIFCGALAANRLAGRLSIPTQVFIGFSFLISAALFNMLYHAFFPPALPWSVAPLFFYTFGMSIVAPGATLLVLDMFPDIRGIAASCQSFVVMVFAALISGVVAPALSSSAIELATGQLLFTAGGFFCWISTRFYPPLQKQP